MYATRVGVIALALLAMGGALLGGGNEASEKELKKLHGTWRFLSHRMNGQESPKEDVAKLKITFSADKWAVSEDGKVIQAGTHKFDPAKKPAQVDAIVTEGEGKGDTMLGIYELKGDTMKVCFDMEGKVRPTALRAKGDQFSAVLEREKKKP
jgi:uncharacterized protein (TIGR03067 family)